MNMVAMERATMIPVQVAVASGIPSSSIRSSTANVAAFGATERNAAALVGAPW